MNEFYDNRAKFIRSFQAKNDYVKANFLNLIQEPDFNFLHIFKKDYNAVTTWPIFQSTYYEYNGFGSPLDFNLTRIVVAPLSTSNWIYKIRLLRGIWGATFEVPILLFSGTIPSTSCWAERKRDFGQRGIPICRRETLEINTGGAAAVCFVAIMGKCERPYFKYDYMITP